MSAIDWWTRPRRVSVVVDNDSWVLPFAARLVDAVCSGGDDAALVRKHDDIPDGTVAFFLGCLRITPPEILARSRRNLVVHASDLPRGRGFSPMTWMILKGVNVIPVCLIDAAQAVDAGNIILRESLVLEGHELNEEIRASLGEAHVRLCMRFLNEPTPPAGTPQNGEPTYYRRRKPEDSQLDPLRSIAEQFDLLRVVDNERYPAFFEYRGHRFKMKIEKLK